MMQKEETFVLAEKLNNSFFIVSFDYMLKLTMQNVHPGLLTRSYTNTFTVN
jgi:hypothetical protein